MQILDSFYNMNELFELGITTIEKIELKRKKYPKIDSVYFLIPKDEVNI